MEFSYLPDELDGSPALTVIISDNGPGISGENREKVFEPFYTTKLRGTGLGLAISRRILLGHGGQIHVGVPRCGGTSICITLPTERIDSQP